MEASTQTVHLTIDMLTAMAPETRPLMFGSTNGTIDLRNMCLSANISEVDLTSGEKLPWKQLFKGIPLGMAQKVIGEGITKFTSSLRKALL